MLQFSGMEAPQGTSATPDAKRVRPRTLLAVALLAFSSGIPLALTGSTLQAWMKAENVNLGVIGLFSLVGLPYTLKFLWSPLLDRFAIPWLGRRRGWILLTQLALMAATAAMAFSRPGAWPVATAAIAFLVAFLSASQDIVYDAWRTDILLPHERGPGAATHIAAYRAAMITSSGLALIAADHIPWRVLYLLLSLTFLVGVAGALLAEEPPLTGSEPKTLRAAVVEPLREFLQRRSSGGILAFAILYKLDVVLAVALMTPFMLELGFNNTDVGEVSKIFGLAASIAGSVLGGILMVRLGMKRSLWYFGIFQGVSGLCFALLAQVGKSYPLMVASIATENFCSGMGNAAYFAFLMAICDRRYSATQFALLSSLMAQSRVILSAPAGYLVQVLGWKVYYLISLFAGIPGLFLLWVYYDRWLGLPTPGS